MSLTLIIAVVVAVIISVFIRRLANTMSGGLRGLFTKFAFAGAIIGAVLCTLVGVFFDFETMQSLISAVVVGVFGGAIGVVLADSI